MSEKFEPGSADALFDRIDKDQTGELKQAAIQLIESCKQMAKLGVPLQELATCCTMAWMMGTNPEMESIFKMMLNTNLNNQNNIN